MRLPARLLSAAVLFSAATASAGEMTVPPPTQVEMLSKLVRFDRSFKDRAGEAAHILVLEAPTRAESHRVAQQLKSLIEGLGGLGGLGAKVEIWSFTNAADLVGKVTSTKPAAVYLAPGFTQREVESMAEGLTHVNVLTASASGADVAAGAVVGFELVEGKPKILVNLPQAEKQGIAFSAAFLSLAKVLR